MSKVLESLLLSYKYWSQKYASSSLAVDCQKKAEVLKHLEEEANKSNMSKEDLDKLLKG